jgi:hypothetical protein
MTHPTNGCNPLPACLLETTADLIASNMDQPNTFHYLDLLFTIRPP